jgi:hypothetical protein
MSTTDNKALRDWLSRFQRLEMNEEQTSGPGDAAAAYGAVIGNTAASMSFDTSPADFNKLLHDLAPEYVKDDIK